MKKGRGCFRRTSLDGEGEEGRAVVGKEPMNERVGRMKRVEKGREAVKGRRGERERGEGREESRQRRR